MLSSEVVLNSCSCGSVELGAAELAHVLRIDYLIEMSTMAGRAARCDANLLPLARASIWMTFACYDSVGSVSPLYRFIKPLGILFIFIERHSSKVSTSRANCDSFFPICRSQRLPLFD